MKTKTLLLSFLLLTTSLAQASPVASHLTDPAHVMQRLDEVTGLDFARSVAVTPLATLLTEPVIRILWATELITHSDWIGIQGLASIHHRIDPGGAEGDASNMFVYSCKGGWLDLGHIINTALSYKVFLQALGGKTLLRPLASFLLMAEDEKRFSRIANQFTIFKKTAQDGNLNGDLTFWAGYFAMRSGYWIENRQARNKQSSKMGHFDSNATSAFTLEDLPSDYYGILIAERLEHRGTTGGVVKAFKRELGRLMSDFHSVDLTNTNDIRGCSSRAEDVLKKDASYYENLANTTWVKDGPGVSQDPRSLYNFTIAPKKTLHHHCVCDSHDNPIKR